MGIYRVNMVIHLLYMGINGYMYGIYEVNVGKYRYMQGGSSNWPHQNLAMSRIKLDTPNFSKCQNLKLDTPNFSKCQMFKTRYSLFL